MRASGVALGMVLALAGCAGSQPGNSDGSAGSGPAGGAVDPSAAGRPGLSEVRVLADEKLREAFGRIETLYEAQNPSTEIVLSYGEGSELAERIAGGEPAEVFATEDPSAMATVTGAGRSTARAETFAGGLLRIVAVRESGAPFVSFVREGGGSRILTDTGVLRP